MRGIKKFDIRNRPSYSGHLVNDLVYSRLAPNILEEFKRLNPRVSDGEEPNRHHQYLTEKKGLPELRDHLVVGMGFMDAHPTNWRGFKSNLDKARPKYWSNYELDIYEEFEGLDIN